jgi:DNA-binding NarL/FixJ family response regulator
MPVKVILADDSELMRSAIRRLLEQEPHISIVGEAGNFAKTIQMVGDLKPDVLLLDLRMPDERHIPVDLIKAQLHCVQTLTISFSNDSEAQELSESYGAVALLDKMKLYSEMVPAIMRFQSKPIGLENKSQRPLKHRTQAA